MAGWRMVTTACMHGVESEKSPYPQPSAYCAVAGDIVASASRVSSRLCRQHAVQALCLAALLEAFISLHSRISKHDGFRLFHAASSFPSPFSFSSSSSSSSSSDDCGSILTTGSGLFEKMILRVMMPTI